MIDAFEFSIRSICIYRAQELEVSSTAKVLTPGIDDWNGEISEDAEGLPA
jgi:hypothetical protein